ncbi:MAG TPA: hypothetical protein VGK67_07385 [Myxococcales bacterium]|jgi:hypothetical protein
MQELAHNDAVRIGERDPILVLRYVGTPTLATAGLLEEVLVKRFDSDPKKQWAFLLVIDASKPVPEKSVQERLAALMAGHASQVAALADVVVGTGFQAATVRFALVAMSMLSKPGYPIKVFRSTPEALEWIAATAPQLLRAADLSATRADVEQFQR